MLNGFFKSIVQAQDNTDEVAFAALLLLILAILMIGGLIGLLMILKGKMIGFILMIMALGLTGIKFFSRFFKADAHEGLKSLIHKRKLNGGKV